MHVIPDILLPNTQLVVLDLDGTLYHKSAMVWRMLFSAPLEDWSIMSAERKTRRLLRGKWFQNENLFYQTYFNTIADISKRTIDEIQLWYHNRYMPLMVSVIRKYYKPTEWLVSFLETCRKSNVQIVVLSDYGYVQEKLEALNIDVCAFDLVISAPELGGLKPAPEIATLLLEKMSVLPSNCLFVGDREDTDGQLAKNVGAKFCLV